MTAHTLSHGMLIVIEGIDGVGKTTLVQRLHARLLDRGLKSLCSKEPTRGYWGNKLREASRVQRLPIEREMEFLLNDRHEHVEQIIAPALQDGYVVLLDRYYPSMIAYQGAAGLSVADLLQANAFAPAPDILFILDLDPYRSLERIHARGDQPDSFENVDNLQRCRDIFLSLRLPGTYVLDASLPIDAVYELAWQHLAARIISRMKAPSLSI